jgi:hypothetical protein
VTVTGRGDQTEVVVHLMGAQPNTAHPGHIHTGTCEAIGSVVQPLQAITVDAGSGSSTTTVGVPPATAMDGQHVIAFHGEAGTPATCAPIPAHVM